MDLTGYLLDIAANAITEIGIRLDENDLRHFMTALTRLESNVRKQSNDIPRLHAIDYYHQVVGNIMTQAKMAGYPNYHPRYAAWKEQRSSGGFWRLAGDLVMAMTYMRVGQSGGEDHAWFAGVPAGIKDSGGKSWLGNTPRGKKKEIAWYGRIMEEGYYGVQFHPARPIFEPTLRDYVASGIPQQKAERGLGIAAREWR
jgi:hypothetical protein